MATIARSRSARLRSTSTSCVLRTAASSIVATHVATALPPTTAYINPAVSKTRAVRTSLSRTFSTALTILSSSGVEPDVSMTAV